MLYSRDDLQAQIDPQHLDLGWRWFTERRVTAPNVQRGGEIVTAVMRQPGRSPLRVYVKIRRNGGSLEIRGECTCPTRQNCGHVAAVLLQALEDRSDAGTVALTVPGVDATAAGPRSPPPAELLVYLLDVDGHRPVIDTRLARRREDGGLVLGRRFGVSRVGHHAPPRFLQAEDIDILGLLDQQPRCPATAQPTLDGPGAEALLGALLGTGRSLWVRDHGELVPLGRSQPRPLFLDWEVDQAAHQRPMVRVPGDARLLLTPEACWYLDADAGAVGPLESAAPAALLDELLAMPPLPPERVEPVRRRLAAAAPELPLPRVIEVQTRPPVPPVPVLRLLSGGDDSAEPGDYARLSFDYGGIEVAWRGPGICLVDGSFVRVERHDTAEHAAAALLEELGLEVAEIRNAEPHVVEFVPPWDDPLDEPEAWLDFQIVHLPLLVERGWNIHTDGFRWRVREPTRWICDIQPGDRAEWFDVALGVEVEGEHIDLLPMLVEALRHIRGRTPGRGDAEHLVWALTSSDEVPALLTLPLARLMPMLEVLLELYGSADAAQSDGLQLSRVQLARLAALGPAAAPAPTAGAPALGAGDDPAAGFTWIGCDEATHLIERLRDLDGIQAVAPPPELAAELRPYQRRGLDWLQFLREYRFGGILADDMGLGKTLQALAHLLVEKSSGRADRPSLVVAPTSLMFNWRDEARRHAPGLRVLVLQGPERARRVAEVAEHDLVLTTYPLLARDRAWLTAQPWHLLILDEAQVIRNPRAQASRVVRELDARHRLCLTGTPMENHLGDLWSLFDVLLPGLLGDARQFRRSFRTPIEKHGDAAAAEHLGRRIRPFLLRRSKAQVAAELPEKTEMVRTVVLEGAQRELYETVRLAMHQRVRAEIERQGLARSHIVVLDALLKLRQVCCDPRLMPGVAAREVPGSAKLEALMEMLPALVEEGRRVLLFSQFTRMLGLIEERVRAAGIGYVKLTGRTRDRQAPVARFQRGNVPLFLISLKAGGVGLNLTAADTVIHYDPWWNPAVERQATDRAHRIGQRQQVFVYKLLCEGTVEEKIHALQQRKQALADGLYGNGGHDEPQWTGEDVEALLGAMANGAPGP